MSWGTWFQGTWHSIRDILHIDAKAVFVTTVIADGAKSKSEFKYAMQSGRLRVQTFTYGPCYDITRSRVNNGIKDLPTHQFVLALLCSWLLLYLRHSLNGNINFKICLLLECAIHAIWQLGPEVFKDLFVFSNLFHISLLMVSSISHCLMTHLYS